MSCDRFVAAYSAEVASATNPGNAFRLIQFAFAYNLLRVFGSKLCGTIFEGASIETIRTRLLKVGARIEQSVRRVWVHIAGGFPLREVLVLERIARMPALRPAGGPARAAPLPHSMAPVRPAYTVPPLAGTGPAVSPGRDGISLAGGASPRNTPLKTEPVPQARGGRHNRT